MRRRLIIIANTGKPDIYCPSVIDDRTNYLSYFQSPEGGYWDADSEIIDFGVNNCTFGKLEEKINANLLEGSIDYWLVVFAGHGWENKLYNTRLELHPTSTLEEDMHISWFKQKFANSRCLFIADCCRKELQPVNESITDNHRKTLLFSTSFTEHYAARCKQLYNEQIAKLSIGLFQIGYAVSFQQEAGNSKVGTGGLYSYNILNEAKRFINTSKRNSTQDEIAAFTYIHTQAKPKVIEESEGKQVPQLIYNRGYQPPFCVIPYLRKQLNYFPI